MELCGNSEKTESSEKQSLLWMLVGSTAEDSWAGELMTKEAKCLSFKEGLLWIDQGAGHFDHCYPSL